MMTLLGQHGQAQDFYRGIELIRFSADAADENAPQGAYVRHQPRSPHIPKTNQFCRSMACFRPANFHKSMCPNSTYL